MMISSLFLLLGTLIENRGHLQVLLKNRVVNKEVGDDNTCALFLIVNIYQTKENIKVQCFPNNFL